MLIGNQEEVVEEEEEINTFIYSFQIKKARNNAIQHYKIIHFVVESRIISKLLIQLIY